MNENKSGDENENKDIELIQTEPVKEENKILLKLPLYFKSITVYQNKQGQRHSSQPCFEVAAIRDTVPGPVRSHVLYHHVRHELQGLLPLQNQQRPLDHLRGHPRTHRLSSQQLLLGHPHRPTRLPTALLRPVFHHRDLCHRLAHRHQLRRILFHDKYPHPTLSLSKSISSSPFSIKEPWSLWGRASSEYSQMTSAPRYSPTS